MNLLSNSAPIGASEVIIVVFLCLLTVASVFALVVLLCNFAASNGEINKALWLLGVFVAGFALRLVFGMCVRGFRDDYSMFTAMFVQLSKGNIGSYYTNHQSVPMYPAVFFIYMIFGGISNGLGATDYPLGAQFFVKLPIIIAELLTALAVYKTASRFVNEKVAVVLCGFICICPVFYASTLWSSPIAFTVMFICWGCYFLARKKYIPTISLFTAAAYSSKEGIYVFPIVCVYAVFHFVRAAINIKNSAPKGREILGGDYVAIISVPVAVAAAFAGAYLISLISTYNFSVNPFVYIYEYLLKPLAGWDSFTLNGLSVYTVFGKNGEVPSVRFPSWVFVCIFAIIITAVVCVVYFSKRNRATLVMLAAYALVTMQIYYPGSSAVSFAVSFGALTAAYALVRDKRLLVILILNSIVFTVNYSAALAVSGFLNNKISTELAAGNTVISGGMSAVPITCSVLALISHLYFTVVSISVGMTGQKRELGAANGLIGPMRELLLSGDKSARKNSKKVK